MRAEFFQTFQMQINGSRSPRAASRQTYPRFSETRRERPENIERCAHSFHKFVRRFGIICSRRVYLNNAVLESHLRADNSEKFRHRPSITQVRHISDNAFPACQKSSRHYGQDGIFRAADIYSAVKRLSAANNKLIQEASPPPVSARCR